jgi:REase_DpnII-MboI
LQSSIKSLEAEEKTEPLTFLERLFSRFHLIARQLRERHDRRPTLDINDEYDVQDLTYALLRINFDDIRKEEWTPSYACGSSRMDFLLKNEGIVVETKKTRSKLSAIELANELISDIERYQAHQDCKMLLCFVYDPEGRIANPESLEELGKPHGNIDVSVLVAPKGK